MTKHQPCIILTRPQRASENLAIQLHDRGYATCINPVLTIKTLSIPLPDMMAVGAVMITSGHAFEALDSKAPYNQSFINLPCFCIGTQTAQRARVYGFKNIYDAAGNGAKLSKLIKETLLDTGKKILHICARDIASTAQDELMADGYKIVSWSIYNAEAATELTKPVIDGLQRNAFKAALFFSTRSATLFMDLVWQYGLDACCQGLIAIGISPSVTDALPAHLWYRVVTAPQPTEESMLLSLQHHLPLR
jgi:uroporphyrinogen-III synthase